MLIWQLDVAKWSYTEKRDWLKDNDKIEPFDYLDVEKEENYMIYFATFREMSDYIDSITEGFNQYWADAIERTDGDEEKLEYHNGSKWDTEIHLTTKQVRVHESLIEAVKKSIKRDFLLGGK